MTFAKNKISGERRLQENAKNYKDCNGQEPFFTLTPAGAKFLKKYLTDKKIPITPVNSGEIEDNKIFDGIPTQALVNFLAETIKTEFPKNSVDSGAIFRLLGAVAVGVHREDNNSLVHLDPVALDAVAQSKEYGRNA